MTVKSTTQTSSLDLSKVGPNFLESDQKKRETVGEASLRLLANPDTKQNVEDTRHEMMKGYFDTLVETAKDGEKAYGKSNHFYVCVFSRKDRLIPNLIRNQFFHRKTRPVPTYDLALYYYDPKDENLQFVWIIPDKETVDKFAGYWSKNSRGERVFVPGEKPFRGEEQLSQWCVWFRQGMLI